MFLIKCVKIKNGDSIVRTDLEPGAELWAGLDGPGPAHIDSWPAQSEIKK